MAISNKNGPARALIMRVMRHRSLSVLQRRTELLYAQTGSVEVQRQPSWETADSTNPLPTLSSASPTQTAIQRSLSPATAFFPHQAAQGQTTTVSAVQRAAYSPTQAASPQAAPSAPMPSPILRHAGSTPAVQAAPNPLTHQPFSATPPQPAAPAANPSETVRRSAAAPAQPQQFSSPRQLSAQPTPVASPTPAQRTAAPAQQPINPVASATATHQSLGQQPTQQSVQRTPTNNASTNLQTAAFDNPTAAHSPPAPATPSAVQRVTAQASSKSSTVSPTPEPHRASTPQAAIQRQALPPAAVGQSAPPAATHAPIAQPSPPAALAQTASAHPSHAVQRQAAAPAQTPPLASQPRPVSSETAVSPPPALQRAAPSSVTPLASQPLSPVAPPTAQQTAVSPLAASLQRSSQSAAPTNFTSPVGQSAPAPDPSIQRSPSSFQAHFPAPAPAPALMRQPAMGQPSQQTAVSPAAMPPLQRAPLPQAAPHFNHPAAQPAQFSAAPLQRTPLSQAAPSGLTAPSFQPPAPSFPAAAQPVQRAAAAPSSSGFAPAPAAAAVGQPSLSQPAFQTAVHSPALPLQRQPLPQATPHYFSHPAGQSVPSSTAPIQRTAAVPLPSGFTAAPAAVPVGQPSFIQPAPQTAVHHPTASPLQHAPLPQAIPHFSHPAGQQPAPPTPAPIQRITATPMPSGFAPAPATPFAGQPSFSQHARQTAVHHPTVTPLQRAPLPQATPQPHLPAPPAPIQRTPLSHASQPTRQTAVSSPAHQPSTPMTQPLPPSVLPVQRAVAPQAVPRPHAPASVQPAVLPSQQPAVQPVQRAAPPPAAANIEQTQHSPQEKMLRAISSLHRHKGTHADGEELSWDEVSDRAKSPASGGQQQGATQVDRVAVPGIMLQGDKPLRRRKAKVTYVNAPNAPTPAPVQRQAEAANEPTAVSQPPSSSDAPTAQRQPADAGSDFHPPAETAVSQPTPTLSRAPKAHQPAVEKPPLESAWTVEPIQPAPPTAPTVSRAEQQAAASNHSAVQGILHRVQAEQPTDSHIELVTPRRPRPTATHTQPAQRSEAAPPTTQSPNHSITESPNIPTSNIQRSEGTSQPNSGMVQTDIGPLPSDLWSLVGDTPPTAQRTEMPNVEPRPAATRDSSTPQTATPRINRAPNQPINQPTHAPQTAVSPPPPPAINTPSTLLNRAPEAGTQTAVSNHPIHQPSNHPIHRAPDPFSDDGILSEDDPPLGGDASPSDGSSPSGDSGAAAVESDSFSPFSGSFGEQEMADDAAQQTPSVTLFADEAQPAAASELTRVQLQPQGMLDEMSGFADVVQLENFATVAEEPEAESQISAYVDEDEADNNVENVRPMTVRLEDEEETAVVYADGDKIENALVNAEIKENDGMVTMYASENDAQSEEGSTVTLLVQLEGEEQPYVIYASASRIDQFLAQAEEQDVNSQLTVYAEEGEAAQNSEDPISLTVQKTGEREKFIVHASNEAVDQLLLVAETLDNSGSFVAYAMEDVAEQNSDAPVQLIVRRVGEQEIKVAYADEVELEEFTKTAENFRSELLINQLAQQIYNVNFKQRLALDRERSHSR